MPPTKLTDSDKQKILALYRQSDETTTSLAQQFSVSTSTISRILKQSLPESEYDTLIQKKRAAGSSKPEVEDPVVLEAAAGLDIPVEADPQPSQPDIFGAMASATTESDSEAEAATASGRRQRRRSGSAAESLPKPTAVAPPKLAKKKSLEPAEAEADLPTPLGEPEAAEAAAEAEPVIAELEEVERDILKHEGVFTDLDEDEEDDEDEDDELDDDELSADLDDDELDNDLDDDLDDEGSLLDAAAELEDFAGSGIHSNVPLHILPLSEAKLPKSCYLVVDRTSDLVTRPLKDFAGLGLIPDAEEEERTLPVFDNHRVAKRYVRRMQRVVKVPDGQVFLKASPYLQAKGITRLLIDGRVYSL
ncbi:MAG: hypothetical protein Fur0046_08310 [Cyanobacteria bacterium J069]